VIQCFLVQAHIHGPQGAGAFIPAGTGLALPGSDSHDGAANLPRGKFPGGDDPSNCRLCQEFGHSGQFVASAAALVSLPYSITVNFIVFKEVIPTLFAVSHSWQGRAPPQR
jgi:hypothetical protein